MRPISKNSIYYQPGEVPNDPAALQRFLREELEKLRAVIALLAAGHLDPMDEPVTKPRDGDIRYFQAINYDPGSGPGIYYFSGVSQSWNQLG